MSLRSNQRFQRGTGPNVSVLLPTRGRPQGLVKALDSLVSLARFPHSVEFLMKADDDDHETLEIARRIGEKVPLRVLVGPRCGGYVDIHVWLNEMARMANGDWLVNWADDVVMQTHNWDLNLLAPAIDGQPAGMADGIFMFVMVNVDNLQNREYFAIRREVFQVLGHLSLSPHMDTWLATALEMLDRISWTALNFKHDASNVDQTAKDRMITSQFTMHHLVSPDTIRQRVADVLKLLDHIERFAAEHPEIVNA